MRIGRDAADESSYTAYLFREGLDKILKKVGEACSLLLIAAKGGDRQGIAEEMANLIYHLMVMMVCKGVPQRPWEMRWTGATARPATSSNSTRPIKIPE